MQNNATYDLLPIVDQVKFYGSVLLDEDFSEQKILEVGQLVLDKIGTKHNDLFIYNGVVDSLGKLALPCNVEIIEAVGTQEPQHSFESRFSPFAGKSTIIDKSVYRVRERNENYFKGDFINYEFRGDYLKVHEKWIDETIAVMYMGRIVDEEGRPLITDREAEAIVEYIAYIKEKQMGYKRIGDGGALAQTAYQAAILAINRARVPVHISQNDIQDLKQVMQSRNQAKYNRHLRRHH